MWLIGMLKQGSADPVLGFQTALHRRLAVFLVSLQHPNSAVEPSLDPAPHSTRSKPDTEKCQHAKLAINSTHSATLFFRSGFPCVEVEG